jgi:GTP pyrophosphokinase
VIGAGNGHILALDSRVDAAHGLAELRFSLKVSDYGQLGDLLSRLAAVPGVSEARRTP